MNRSLLCAVAVAFLTASAANAADRYSHAPALPAAQAKPLWKRLVALEWIERAPRLAPALQPYYAAPQVQAPAPAPSSLLNWSNKPAPAAGTAQLAAISATSERVPGGLYSRAISQVQSTPAPVAVAAPSPPSPVNLAGVAPTVDPRPRQAPQLP